MDSFGARSSLRVGGREFAFFRLEALETFFAKPMPKWGGDIALDFQDIYYYLKPADHQGKTWDDVPEEIKKTFDRLGIPEAERKFLSGVKASSKAKWSTAR